MDKRDSSYVKVRELFEEKMQELYNEICEAVGGFELGPDMEQSEGAFLHDLTEVIGRLQTREIDVNDFMDKVPTVQKRNYILAESDGQEHDVEIFVGVDNPGMCCELCDGLQEWKALSFIGTGDSREPKYCFPHYKQINKNSQFRRVRGSL
jgi:hypothetical protein